MYVLFIVRIIAQKGFASGIACNRFGSQLLHASLMGQLSNSSNHGGGGRPLGEFQRKSRIKGLTTKAVASNRTPKRSAFLNLNIHLKTAVALRQRIITQCSTV
jgi:hypothetical protein